MIAFITLTRKLVTLQPQGQFVPYVLITSKAFDRGSQLKQKTQTHTGLARTCT